MSLIAHLNPLKRLISFTIVRQTRNVSHFTYQPDDKAPIEGERQKMNMFTAINNAMDIALAKDESTLLFGEGKCLVSSKDPQFLNNF